MNRFLCIAKKIQLLAALTVSCLVYFMAAENLGKLKRPVGSDELQVALPILAQLLMAGGDRYLAANFAGFRALVSTTDKMQNAHYRTLARIQTDAAWLNPAHVDNYYLAAAVLPWNGGYTSGQLILRRAKEARPFDWQPTFFYAFNLYHFRGEAAAASKALRDGARREANEGTRVMMESLAVRWAEKGHDTRAALTVVESMATETRHGLFRTHLKARAERLRGLLAVEEAQERFYSARKIQARSIEELISAGYLARAPIDPFGLGYEIDAHGKAILKVNPSQLNAS